MPSLDALRRRNAANPDAVNPDVMPVLYDVETLSGAFLSMYCRHGSMEDGQRVLKSKGLPWLHVISEKLKSGSYTFPPLPQLEPKSMNVPKYDGTLHETPIWWHKTVPEAMRLTLEAVFEPSFLRTNHGYRPSKGCYTALKEVKYGFAGVDYFLVGDLSDCIAEFDKGVMIKVIQKRIPDGPFLKLLEECIKHAYVDLSAVSYRNIGLPQTTLLSPILCNIYLHAMDIWFEDLGKCLAVGGQVEDASGNVYGVIENRSKWGSEKIADIKAWRSPTLKGKNISRDSCAQV